MNIIAVGVYGSGNGMNVGDNGNWCGMGESGFYDGDGFGQVCPGFGCGYFNVGDGNGKGFRLKEGENEWTPPSALKATGT